MAELLSKMVASLLPGRFALLGEFLVARIRGGRGCPETLFTHPFPGMECVAREAFILERAEGRRVLHFGFLDIPIMREKIAAGTLLHSRLGKAASYLYGVDVNAPDLEEYRRITGDTENCARDLLQGECDLAPLKGRFDLILFPEVLEHLANPGGALRRLREIAALNPGSSVLVTVPNAYSLEHFVSAAGGVELVHPDHYYYFSPATLGKLLGDCGFSSVEIRLYRHDADSTAYPGITSHGILAIAAP